jgi:hypothetical protein
MAVTLAGPALASHVVIDASATDEVTVGETTNVAVSLQSIDGAHLSGTTVIVSQHASFGGVEGYAEIDRAVTDENGIASVAYKPRSAGQHELRVEFVSTEGEVETSTMVLDATGGAVQLIHSPAGVDVPGVGVELVMVILATAWFILLRVALRLVSITRAGVRPGVLETELTA